MKYSLLTIVIIFLGIQPSFSQNKQDSDIVIGSTFSIHSDILGEDRTCIVSLPDSYEYSDETDSYPIIILLDGYAHFKTAASTVHFMSITQNRNRLMPESIVIAIENVDRERDFTVTKIKTKRKNTMGGGRDFLKFIEKELIPYVDKTYKTKPVRTLIGHSLGGLLAINAYLDKNSLFDAYIAIDPSLWWDEKMMQQKVAAAQPVSLQKKLYIATANQGERNRGRNKKRHDAFYKGLTQKAKGTLQAKIEYFENEHHRSVPLIAMYQGLKFLFEN
ncbi:alpha/beta hydrolase [Kordia sp.]|uniref:alpha/beta hydrolase n=1 Tax=Kordia sp. TaxID=1965332 RepID=UPI003D6AB453